MKRLLLAFLFVTPAFAQIPGPWGIFGGPILSSRLPLGAPVGATAFTSDMGLMVSNGLTWAVFTGGGGSGSVTSISVVGANGFSGSVATPTTTPALSLSTSITGLLKGSGGALQAAGNPDIYALFGCAGVSTTYLNGAGGCSTPAGGNVSNTGSPTSGQLAEWTNATTVQGLTPAGDLSLSGSTFTVTKTNGTAFGTFATQNYASPPAIGATTPAAGAFTTLSASSGTFSAVSGGVTVGSPTGGVKGAGTLNMAGCYINGVACAAGGTVNSGTLGQLGYYAASGVAISPLSLASNFVVNSGTLSPSQPLNAQTGTSYAFLATDAGKLITFSNASAIAATLSQATTTGFTAGFSFDVQNTGAGTLTITPTTSTINGNASLTVAANTGCTVSSDGTNYQVSACTAIAPANLGAISSYSVLANSTGSSAVPTAQTNPTIQGVTFTNLSAGAPASATTFNYFSGTWSGTGAFAAAPLRAGPYWNVVTDTAAFPNTGVGATGLAGGYEWYDYLQSGWDGFRFGFECFIKIGSAPYTIVYDGAQQNTNTNCLKSRVEGDVSEGGLAGSYGGAAGTIFSFNPFQTVLPAGVNYAYVGAEIDTNKTAFAGPPAEAHGLNVALSGNCTAGTGPCASEIPALYDDSGLDLGDADNNGTSYWDHLITTGSYAHAPAANLTSTFLGAQRRLIGSGTAVFNQPAFRYGVDLNQSVFAAPLSGTYSTTISAITPSTGSSAGTSVVFTFGTMSGTPPPGSIITVSGATGTAAAYNQPFVVVGNGSTTTAQVATALAVTCSSSCGTATVTEPIGEAWQSPGAAIDPNGNAYHSGLYTLNGVSSQSASVGSIVCDPQGFGGYACGAYFGVSNPTIHISTYGSAVAPTINVINSKVVAALLMTDQTSFVSSASGAPVDRFTGLSTQVATGCSASETLTLTNTNSGTAATIAITASGGYVTSATISNAGTYTTMAATPTWTTSGTCTTANINTWLQIGFGISSITLTTNGSGYGVEPAPFIWTTATGQGTIQTMAKLIAVMTPVVQPVVMNPGPLSSASWGTTGLAVGSSGTQVLTDSTANDAAATLAAWALPIYNFGCGSGTCTVTNLAELYLPAPLDSSGTWSGSTLYSLLTGGNVKIVGTENVSGLITGTAGLTVTGAAIALNGSSNFATTINAGTSTAAVSIAGGSGGGAVNVAAGTGANAVTIGNTTGPSNTNLVGNVQLNGVKYASSTAPTVSSGFNTSGYTVTGTSTGAFQVTVGTGTGTSTGVLTMPAATTGWACSTADVSTPGSNMVQETGSTTTSVTVTNYVRTTGVAGNFTNSDKIVFVCGAF